MTPLELYHTLSDDERALLPPFIERIEGLLALPGSEFERQQVQARIFLKRRAATWGYARYDIPVSAGGETYAIDHRWR